MAGSETIGTVTVFALATPVDRPGALAVWQAANLARLKAPSVARIARVREKLSDDAACTVVGVDGDEVIAMALAQAARDENGTGPVRPGEGHISMVFVAPDRWDQGIGGQLVDALHHEMTARGWQTASLGTGAGNQRARRLYERLGYEDTGESELYQGEEIIRYQRQLEC